MKKMEISSKTEKAANILKTKDVEINLCDPPSQVFKLHQNIYKDMTKYLASKGYKLIKSKDAPAIVPVVYISRIVADIKRDLKRITGSK